MAQTEQTRDLAARLVAAGLPVNAFRVNQRRVGKGFAEPEIFLEDPYSLPREDAERLVAAGFTVSVMVFEDGRRRSLVQRTPVLGTPRIKEVTL